MAKMEGRVSADTSHCFKYFGHEDFDLTRVQTAYPDICPVKGCETPTTWVTDNRGERRYCATHGIRLHSNTFVYWNGEGRKNDARLRNFPIRPDIAREVALNSVEKAESHRLGYEMSEDALTWNVFVGLAEAKRLRDAVLFLTGDHIEEEPQLYLWGELVDLVGKKRGRFHPLDAVRAKLEPDIKRFKTEPDAMLVLADRLLVCIEAKFGSGNPLAYTRIVEAGEKPIDRDGLLRRYLDNAGSVTKRIINRDSIGSRFHTQLFRNIVFASEMAQWGNWRVANLVSQTQWESGLESDRYSFMNPEADVRRYLTPDLHRFFTFRTWEALQREVISTSNDLSNLDAYLRSKSAHFQPAFCLGGSQAKTAPGMLAD